MANIEKRIAELETLTETETGGDKSLAELIRLARKRARRRAPIPQTRITRLHPETPTRIPRSARACPGPDPGFLFGQEA